MTAVGGRQLVVVDTETTGLDHHRFHLLEVSAINMTTGEQLHFVPHISNFDLGNADRKAMQINRYYERGTWENMLTPAKTADQFDKLSAMLEGNTLGGSNPKFDADFLFKRIGDPWHHRLGDISCYAAPAMGRTLDDLPGFNDVCTFLKVINATPHSAMGDALATVECFKKLALMYSGIVAVKDRNPEPADFPITNMVP